MSHNQDFSDQPLPQFLPDSDFYVQLEKIKEMLRELQAEQLATAQVLELLDTGKMVDLIEHQSKLLLQASEVINKMQVDAANQEILLHNLQSEQQKVMAVTTENLELFKSIKILLDAAEAPVLPWWQRFKRYFI